jgi:hypothetical protein
MFSSLEPKDTSTILFNEMETSLKDIHAITKEFGITGWGAFLRRFAN